MSKAGHETEQEFRHPSTAVAQAARGHAVWAVLGDSSRVCCRKKPSGEETASLYPYCAFLRLHHLIEVRANPRVRSFAHQV